jgi:hypothetical protein
MGWVRRWRNRRDAREAQTGIATDLADFLAHATERGALRQAIVDASQSEQSQLTPAQDEAQGGIVAQPETDRFDR